MSDQSGVASKGGWLKWALVGVAIFGVAAVLYIIARASSKPELDTDLKSVSRGEMKKLETPLEAAVAPPNAFQNAAGEPVRIADFKGKIVVLNLWATWCAPCVAEMPTLDAVAADYGKKGLAVLTISQDSQGETVIKPFFEKHPLPHLKGWIDPENQFGFHYNTGMLPTTVIYDAQGKEMVRVVGAMDWASKEGRELIEAAMAS